MFKHFTRFHHIETSNLTNNSLTFYHRNPAFHISLTLTHPCFCRFFCPWFIRKHTHKKLTCFSRKIVRPSH